MGLALNRPARPCCWHKGGECCQLPWHGVSPSCIGWGCGTPSNCLQGWDNSCNSRLPIWAPRGSAGLQLGQVDRLNRGRMTTQRLCKFALKVTWNQTPVCSDMVAEWAKKNNDHADRLAAMTLFQLPASVQHARHQFKHALGQSYIACGHLHTCWCSVVFEMGRKNLMFVRKTRPKEKNRKLQEEKALEVSVGVFTNDIQVPPSQR